MSDSRRFRLVPEELYQRFFKEDSTLLAEYDTKRTSQKELDEKAIAQLQSKGQIIDELGYIRVIYVNSNFSMDKQYNLKYKDKKLEINLFDAVRYLNKPTETCSTKMLILVKILYDLDCLKENITCKDSSGKKYFFAADSFWGQ